ncbi:MAG: DUF3883 domain-containing protein [Candidatus Competibacteraceae bacterium]|nr:MAG: DUF3883 domain-containing protein [Candidatus Competibacteraceae bacterium]
MKNGNFDHARACAFAKVLALGEYSKTDHSETKGTGTHNYEFFPTKTYVSWIITDKRRAYVELSTASNHQCQNWIELLRDKAWVPTKGEGVVKPKDVLLWPDQDNPDAPVADLDDATRKGLEPLREAVNFGKDVRQYGPLDRLINAVKHSETSNEILVDLWREILNDTQLDVERLKKNARKHDLIPVKNPCCDGKTRIGSTRLLSGNSSQGQFDFKGFLVAVADTLLADLATKLVEILEIPERTTADQATDYLEWVWSAVAQQNAFHVQKQVVSAWRIVADEPSVWPKIKAIREGGKMQLFCRQPGVYHGKWLPLPSTNPEPVWNDAPEKAACLRDNDSICLEAWIFKKKDINVNNLIGLLGISRLSDGQRFSLNVDIYGNKSSLSEQTQRLRLITKAIINAHGQDEEEDELSTTELTLYSVQSISRTFSIDGREPNEDNLDARWDGDKSMYVVGDRSVTWATDLRPLVQQALRLGGNARGLRFLDLLPLLDNDKTFNRKYEQLCRELGVPEFEMEPNTKVENPNKTVKPTTPEEIINLRQVESPPPLPPVPPPNLNEPEGKGEDVERIDKRRWFNRIKTIVDPAISRFMGRVKQAPNRFLIDGPRSEEEEEEKLACESKLSKDDTDARQKVFEYEQGEGRTPTIATRNQAGYDVSSVDDSSGHERKIEVKGLQGTWENDATVTMTGRQFDDARMKEGDWWLYVVDNIGTDHPCVIRIHNPAKGTRRFYLYACHWRDKAETEPSEPLVGPDDGDE